jgi:hypothetical protein
MSDVVDCNDLLDQLLLVHSHEELDALIDSTQACFTRTFLRGAANAIEAWLVNNEPNAWHIWPVLEYAVNRVNQLLLRGDLAALWAETERKYRRNDFISHYEQTIQYYHMSARRSYDVTRGALGMAR